MPPILSKILETERDGLLLLAFGIPPEPTWVKTSCIDKFKSKLIGQAALPTATCCVTGAPTLANKCPVIAAKCSL